MAITILKKEHTRLRVNKVELPLATNPILGDGIDVTTLPEGHLTCNGCGCHLFECWVYLDNHRLEMGCMKCGQSYRLLFPMDVSLSRFGRQGRFTCKRSKDKAGNKVDHSNAGFILIHNTDTVSVGCEKCNTEVNIKIRTESNIITTGDVN